MIVDEAPGCIGSFLRLKSKHSHLKLVLSIGGGAGSQNFAAVAATAATRDTFARSARKLVDASGFDGIDSKFSVCHSVHYKHCVTTGRFESKTIASTYIEHDVLLHWFLYIILVEHLNTTNQLCYET